MNKTTPLDELHNTPGLSGKYETNSTVDRKERRKQLSCSICPPNRGENARRKPKPNRYKNKRK